MKKMLAMMACVFIVLLYAGAAAAKSIYVDSVTGDDRYSGKTPDRPIKTLSRLAKIEQKKGDFIFLKRDSIWYEAYIPVKSDIAIAAYGEGEMPRLVGAKKIIYQPSGVEKKITIRNVKNHAAKFIFINQKPLKRYEKINQSDVNGYYFDEDSNSLILFGDMVSSQVPLEILIPTVKHVVELQDRSIENLSVRDIEIGYAYRFGIAPWYQSGGRSYGQIQIKNNRFRNNIYSAIAFSGKNRIDFLEIKDNKIVDNGAEGIYIGIAAITKQLLIEGNVLGSGTADTFGWAGEGTSSDFNGDGIDIKSGNNGVIVRNNHIAGISGRFGIQTKSASSVIEGNTIENVRLGDVSSGIEIDIEGGEGKTYVRDNRINMAGPAIRILGSRINPGNNMVEIKNNALHSVCGNHNNRYAIDAFRSGTRAINLVENHIKGYRALMVEGRPGAASKNNTLLPGCD